MNTLRTIWQISTPVHRVVQIVTLVALLIGLANSVVGFLSAHSGGEIQNTVTHINYVLQAITMPLLVCNFILLLRRTARRNAARRGAAGTSRTRTTRVPRPSRAFREFSGPSTTPQLALPAAHTFHSAQCAGVHVPRGHALMDGAVPVTF